MKFKPSSDRVVVKRLDRKSQTEGGILLPERAQDAPKEGTVVAVGPGRWVGECFREPRLSVGHHVLFSTYAGTEVRIDGEDYLIMGEEEILGIFEA